MLKILLITLLSLVSLDASIQKVRESYVIVQTAGDTYVGNELDQTYSVNPFLIGVGESITIIDTGGNNTVELVGGLRITSSVVVSNELIIHLSNGASVNIRGADKFTFDIGANQVNSVVGTQKNFASFVTDVLGLATVPTQGAAAVNGGAIETIIAGGGGSSNAPSGYSIDENSNNALMGPLKNAIVKVYRPNDLNTPIEQTQTNSLGAFSLSLNGISNDEMLLTIISGGVDVDVDDDGVLDEVATENNGTIHGFAKASELKSSTVNVTLLSEVVYQYTKHLIGKVHPDDLEKAINNISSKLLKQTLNRSLLSYRDINNFIPMQQSHRDKLDFEYSKLLGVNSLATFIHNNSDSSLVESKLNETFKERLTIRDSRVLEEKNYFQLTLSKPIKSSIVSNGSNLKVDLLNNTSILSDFIQKGSNVTLTITPDSTIQLVSWKGCTSVSDDLTECKITDLNKDIEITPLVRYKNNTYADKVKDVSDFYIIIDNNNYTLSLDLDSNQTMRSLVESIVADDIIISISDTTRFFKKVTSVHKIDEYNYTFSVEDVSFLELYARGGAYLDKKLTYDDLSENLAITNRSLSRNGDITLLPPTKPNDDEFVIRFGKPTVDNQNRAIESSVGNEVEIAPGLKVSGKLSYKLDTQFNYNIDFLTLESMRFVVIKEIKSELKITSSIDLMEKKAKKLLANPIRYRMAIPGSPLWVTVEISFYIGADVKIETSASIGGEYSSQSSSGFNYVGGHFNIINSNKSGGKMTTAIEPIKISSGAYLQMIPQMTIIDIAGVGIDTKAGIYMENTLLSLSPDSDSNRAQADYIKGKLFAKLSAEFKFVWATWLSNNFEWARELESDINNKLKAEGLRPDVSRAYTIKEWNLPMEEENPAFLNLTSEVIDEKAFSDESIDKVYNFKIKNSGDKPLEWRVIKGNVLSSLLAVSPMSGTLVKDEEMDIIVVLREDDLTPFLGLYEGTLKFENITDEGNINKSNSETGTTIINAKLDVEKRILAPTQFRVGLYGESIKVVNFHWDYETYVHSFKIYKSNYNTATDSCENSYTIFNTIDGNVKNSMIHLNDYRDIIFESKRLEAGKKYCFKVTANSHSLESEASDMVTLEIPENATLQSNIADKDNNPIENARIYLTSISNNTVTDGTGNYIFENLVPGRYKIVVEAEGYIRVEAEVRLEAGETKIFERQLVANEDLEGVEGTIGGKIQNALNGSGISGVSIEIRRGINIFTGEIVDTIVTDDGGNYSATLETGVYTFSISANGYSSTSATINIFGNESRQKDLSLSPILSEGNMRIVLNWGKDPRDLDSHLVKKVNGSQEYHIYYRAQSGTNGDNLDHDDVTSYGPETVTIDNVDTTAVYTYYVHHYAGSSNLKSSSAKVDVYYGNQRFTYSVPNGDGIYWKVFEIENGTITPCILSCIQSGTSSIVRNINEDNLFNNLPSKD
jgi:hypothetical protein